MATITSIRLESFRRYKRFSVSFDQFNVLVGPNNSGKSSILDAIRVLGAALQIGRRRLPQPLIGFDGQQTYGYPLSSTQLPISDRNIHRNYQDTDTVLKCRFSNGNTLAICFPPNEVCRACFDPLDPPPGSTADFARSYPLNVVAVPVLAPFEEHEKFVTDQYFQSAWGTRLSARLFRNYWRKRPEYFKEFSDLVASTWPNIRILPPEARSGELTMFHEEDRILREIYWAGFGFQVWLQMLTHRIISRKEIENYLLDIDAIAAAIQSRIKARDAKSAVKTSELKKWVTEKLIEITDAMKTDMISQMISSRFGYDRTQGTDVSTISKDCMDQVAKKWTNVSERFEIVPGKRALSELNGLAQKEFNVSFTPSLILNHMRKANIPPDLDKLLGALDRFCSRTL